MPLGDKQVLASQVAAGHSDYVIPGAVSLQLKAVQALFTDNGAGSDWLPAVVAISDSGHVFWRAVDQGVKVTAGSDAEVSWFPGVKPGGGTVTINEQAALWLLSTDAPYTVTAGLTDTIIFPNANWFGAAILADANDGRFDLLERWQFFLSASVLWESADFPRAIWISCNFGHGLGFLPQPTDFHVRTPAGTFTTSDPTGLGPLWCRDTMLVQPDSFFGGDLQVYLNVQNGDVVARSIVQAFYACYAVNFAG